jgi:hypothetical protein
LDTSTACHAVKTRKAISLRLWLLRQLLLVKLLLRWLLKILLVLLWLFATTALAIITVLFVLVHKTKQNRNRQFQ